MMSDREVRTRHFKIQRVLYLSYGEASECYEILEPTGDHKLDFEIMLTGSNGETCFISWLDGDLGYYLGLSEESFVGGELKHAADMADHEMWAALAGEDVRIGYPHEYNHQFVVIEGIRDKVYCCSNDHDAVIVTRNKPGDLHAELDRKYDMEGSPTDAAAARRQTLVEAIHLVSAWPVAMPLPWLGGLMAPWLGIVLAVGVLLARGATYQLRAIPVTRTMDYVVVLNGFAVVVVAIVALLGYFG